MWFGKRVRYFGRPKRKGSTANDPEADRSNGVGPDDQTVSEQRRYQSGILPTKVIMWDRSEGGMVPLAPKVHPGGCMADSEESREDRT
jgi:hypothetical protein